jgi:hypothetical protein
MRCLSPVGLASGLPLSVGLAGGQVGSFVSTWASAGCRRASCYLLLYCLYVLRTCMGQDMGVNQDIELSMSSGLTSLRHMWSGAAELHALAALLFRGVGGLLRRRKKFFAFQLRCIHAHTHMATHTGLVRRMVRGMVPFAFYDAVSHARAGCGSLEHMDGRRATGEGQRIDKGLLSWWANGALNDPLSRASKRASVGEWRGRFDSVSLVR